MTVSCSGKEDGRRYLVEREDEGERMVAGKTERCRRGEERYIGSEQEGERESKLRG